MNERQKKLLEKMHRTGRISISKESEAAGVSTMTIRRDLREMEKAGLAIIVQGGAVPANSSNNTLLLPTASSSVKRKMAVEAVRLLKPGMTVMFSVGTTTLEIARALAAENIPLNLVTNSLPVAAALFQTKIQVLLTGGTLRLNSLDLVGPLTEKYLSEYHVDVLVTGCDGAISDEGFYTNDLNLANVENKSVQVSDKVVVVSESSKFGKRSFTKFASVDDVSTVITDNKISEEDLEKLRSRNIKSIVV